MFALTALSMAVIGTVICLPVSLALQDPKVVTTWWRARRERASKAKRQRRRRLTRRPV